MPAPGEKAALARGQGRSRPCIVVFEIRPGIGELPIRLMAPCQGERSFQKSQYFILDMVFVNDGFLGNFLIE